MKDVFVDSVKEIMQRELDNLYKEISLYNNEADLWKVSGQIINSAGNLCLHICGNLQHFVGAILGNTGYQRNRDYEFSARGLSKQELLEEIQKTKIAIDTGLTRAQDEVLSGDYPLRVQEKTFKTIGFLIHLTAHLQYHQGQINYHRRILA